MKVEILFRGKRPNSGKWIEGYLYKSGGFSYILHEDHFVAPECACEVLTEIVGQFTGLIDKNGNKIFEDDIVLSETDKPMVITWSNRFASFCLNRNGWAFSHWFGEAVEAENCEVIGNIHDNPELLK